MRGRLCVVVGALAVGFGSPVWAQLTVIGQFNPSNAGSLCGAAFDHTTGRVWVYQCSGADVQCYTSDGVFECTVPRPGESANDVDIDIAPETLMLGTTRIPEGTLLFFNGESGVAEIYAVAPDTGLVLGSLTTEFGVSHVVGGAYHPRCDTFFLVQDNVPGTEDENRVAEVDPGTGAVLSTFQVTGTFNVSFGDIEVSIATGNLYLVSSLESTVAAFTTSGSFVQELALPSGVSSLSGIGLDDGAGEAWVAGTSGNAWRLDGLAQVSCEWDLNGDGDVGIVDLLALLAAWGTAPCGPPDFNGDGTVGIVDLLEFLANWGPCA